jgi:hypothetical protein
LRFGPFSGSAYLALGLFDESQELMALAESDPASRTPSFVDVVERSQGLKSAIRSKVFSRDS